MTHPGQRDATQMSSRIDTINKCSIIVKKCKFLPWWTDVLIFTEPKWRWFEFIFRAFANPSFRCIVNNGTISTRVFHCEEFIGLLLSMAVYFEGNRSCLTFDLSLSLLLPSLLFSSLFSLLSYRIALVTLSSLTVPCPLFPSLTLSSLTTLLF